MYFCLIRGPTFKASRPHLHNKPPFLLNHFNFGFIISMVYLLSKMIIKLKKSFNIVSFKKTYNILGPIKIFL